MFGLCRIAGLLQELNRFCMHGKITDIGSKSIVVAILTYFIVNAILYGLNLPNLDDWRYFLPGAMNWNDKFAPLTPINDTISAFPILFDQLIFRVFDYNFKYIRVSSFFWLLAYLMVIFKISSLEKNSLFSGFCVLSAALVLRVGGYWDYPTYIAYHQALPLICCVFVIYLVGRSEYLECSLKGFQLVLISLSGLVAGLSYISGAVSVVILGMAYLFLACFCENSSRKSLTRVGWLLLFIGAAILCFQYYSVSAAQGSLLKHSHAASNVLPNSAKFWFFAFGVLAMGVGVGGGNFILNFIVVPTIFALIFVFSIKGIFEAKYTDSKQRQSFKRATIYLPAIGILIGYVGIVSFGRGGFLVTDYDIREISVAKSRFHFWWVSALLPCIAFSIAEFFKYKNIARLLATLMLAWVTFLFFIAGAYGYKQQYERINMQELMGLQCVKQAQMNKNNSILCRDLYPTDIKVAVDNVMKKRSEFFNINSNYRQSKVVRIDSVPPGAQRGGVIDKIADLGAFYEIVGWMPMNFGDEQSKIMIRTKSALDEVYINFIERPDVAEALKNSDFVNSGFKIYIPKNVEYSCIYAVHGALTFYPIQFIDSNCEK